MSNQKTKSDVFTIDSDNSEVLEMPSISMLLNRKKAAPQASQKQEKTNLQLPPPQLEEVELKEQSKGFEIERMGVSTPSLESQPSSANGPLVIEMPSLESQPSSHDFVMPVLESTLESPASNSSQPVGAGSILFESPVLELAPIDTPRIQTQSPIAPTLTAQKVGGTSTIQAAKRRSTKTQQILTATLASVVRSKTDAIAIALKSLKAEKIRGVLFLSILPPEAGSQVPKFSAKVAIEAEDRSSLWQGLVWDPVIVPELWNYFIKSGQVELGPPGSMTNIMSNRNLVRAALGISQDEYLILIRVGSSQACKGILAVIYNDSIATKVGDIVQVLETA